MTETIGVRLSIADTIWLATPCFMRRSPASGFSHETILRKVAELNHSLNPSSVSTHLSTHCVASKKANPATLRILTENTDGSLRLFRGEIRSIRRGERVGLVPSLSVLPPQYKHLLQSHAAGSSNTPDRSTAEDPILAISGVGKEMWKKLGGGEAFIRALREDYFPGYEPEVTPTNDLDRIWARSRGTAEKSFAQFEENHSRTMFMEISWFPDRKKASPRRASFLRAISRKHGPASRCLARARSRTCKAPRISMESSQIRGSPPREPDLLGQHDLRLLDGGSLRNSLRVSGGFGNRCLNGESGVCTGALTLGEVLVSPYENRDANLVARYKALLSPPVVDVLDFTSDAADHYARIRADRGIARGDAMQLACAAAANVDLFLTNDHRLQGKVIPGIQFIGGLDGNVL